VDDLTTGTGMNAFLWNRISQGFSPVVEDAPPQESWRAWCRGHRDHKLRAVPYQTTPSSPSESSSLAAPHELRCELGAAATAAPKQQTRPHRRHANPQLADSESGSAGTTLAGGTEGETEKTETEAASVVDVATVMMVEARSVAGTDVQTGAASTVTVVAASSDSVSSSGTTLGKGPAGAGRYASIGDEGEEEVADEAEEEEEKDRDDHDYDHHDDHNLDSGMDYEDVLTADLSGPPRSREWALPFPRSRSEQTSLEASQAHSGSLRPRQISFKINAPDDLELTVIQCTFSRVEDVGENCKPKLKVAYASKSSSSRSQAPSGSR